MNFSMTKEEADKIQKTATTLYELRDHTNINFCKEIADFLSEKLDQGTGRLMTNDNFSAFVVSRYVTNHLLLEAVAQKYGEDLQVIELGSGFTPHFLNLQNRVGKYIEADLETNSHLKNEISKKLINTKSAIFVAGSITLDTTWKEIATHINITKPVYIFCEGVIAHYFDDQQKNKVAEYCRPLMCTAGSCFVIDDTLRNHSEFYAIPIIREGMDRIALKSGSSVYAGSNSTFSMEFERWTELFSNKGYTLGYVLSKPEMDQVIESFKLILCTNDPGDSYQSILLELSKKIKGMRVWNE